MFKKFFSIFLIFVFLANNGLLLAEEPLSLNKLIQGVKENNPDILAAKKRWEASQVRVPMAKSLDNPSVGVSFMKIPKGTIKLDKTMSEDRLLSISQMLPLFGKLSLKGKIALVESQVFAAEYKDKELEIINMLKKSYYDLFMNYKEIELNQDSLKLLQAITTIAEAKYATGDIPQEEVYKLDLEIAKLANHIQNLEEEQSAKETHINTLLNLPPDNPLGRPELTEDISFNIDINSLYKYALMNQPELLIFSYAIERNKAAKSLAKRSILPDLMAQISLRGFTGGGIGPWDLMMAISLPFWFWTKQRYEIKEAIINLDEAKVAYEAMKNKAFSQIKDLATQVGISKNKIKLYRTNLIPLLEGSIDSSLASFRSGKGDLMMLLDTERMLINTKMEYYKSLVEYNMNLSDLERNLGVNLESIKSKGD